MRFSIRTLLISTAGIAILLVIALEYGMMVRADGGGDQLIKITSLPDATARIDFVPIQLSQPRESVVNAISTGNQTELLLAIAPTQVKSFVPRKADSEISIHQQWSFTEMSFTKRRVHYTQTYQHIVLNLVFADGSNRQYTIELPEYCGTTTIDLSRSKQNQYGDR